MEMRCSFNFNIAIRHTQTPKRNRLKIAWSAQHNQKVAYLSPGSFERPGGVGDHTHAHQPLRPWPAASARPTFKWLAPHLAAIHPPLGWRALAPCVTSPHPETNLPESKHLCLCLLSKSELKH